MTYIEFDLNGDGKLYSVIFDATPRVGHSFSADITEHPVETGANIADHIRARNLSVSLDAVITDYPLASLSEASKGASVEVFSSVGTKPLAGRSVAAADLFQQIQKNGVLCTLYTSLRKYNNMALKEFSVAQSVADRGAIRFSLSFQEIRKVETSRVAVSRVKKPSGQKVVNAGRKEGEGVTENTVSVSAKSVSAQIVDAARNGTLFNIFKLTP